MDAKLREELKHIGDIDNAIADERIRGVFLLLLNIVEQSAAENQQLREEIQKLKDENSRLKGEQGKPSIRPQKNDKGDISSEDERDKNKKNKSDPRNRSKKKETVKIDRTVYCDVDRSLLPDDAVSKGYETVVVQDIIIQTDNVEFIKHIYYSPSLKKRFVGKIPEGYGGEFGPGVKSLILVLYNESNMTQPAIKRFFEAAGVRISSATISGILTDEKSVFHQEKADIVAAGLKSTDYQQMDDTSARVNGKNHYTHILCNPFYTAYFTRPKKDRLTLLELLSGGELNYRINEESMALMQQLKLSEKQLNRIKEYCSDELMDQKQLDDILFILFPNPKKHSTSRRIISEASALVAYQEREDAIERLVCDDAPQFKAITSELSLCWVHEGRHYKKLRPFVGCNQNKLEAFRDQFWVFYHKLLSYKDQPNSELAERLSIEFDEIFSQKTGYDQLDERIEKTKEKKNNLLLVLRYPQIPLHNNASELGARVQARKRDVSLQTRNDKGTQSKDTMMTIVQTARKLCVNVIDYIKDRVTGHNKMPSLAELTITKSQTGSLVCDTG